MKVNAHVQGETDRLDTEYNAGVEAGYEANPNQLPEFYYSKPIYLLTARERGYFFGREIKLQEMKDGG